MGLIVGSFVPLSVANGQGGGVGQQQPKDRFAVIQTTASPVTLDGGVTYTQDFTAANLSNFKAAIFEMSGATSSGTVIGHGRVSIGFCDSAGNQAFRAGRSRDGFTYQDTASHKAPAAVIGISDDNGPQYRARASFHSVIPNGVRLRWTRTISGDTSPTSIEPYQVTCLLIGGTNQTKAFVGADGNCCPGSSTVTTPNFQADLYVFVGFIGPINTDDVTSHDFFSLGFAARQTGIPQAATSHLYPDDALGPPFAPAQLSESFSMVRDNRVASIRNISSGTEHNAEVTAFTSTGFTWTCNDGISFYYLGLKFADSLTASVTVESLPTTPGTHTFTGLGLKPQIVLTGSSLVTTTNVFVGTPAGVEPTSGAQGYSIFSSANEGACSVSNADGLLLGNDLLAGEEPSVAKSYAGGRALLLLPNNPGTTSSPEVEATFSAMNSSGFTLDFLNPGAGRMIVLGIESFPPSP
ncbi:MAG: hypothetical protein HOP15_02795 [Planctomycetes bacterium]|nr:hypothetical protein [Planctomycetota bacterium]